MKDLLFATGNADKARELRLLLRDHAVTIHTLREFPDYVAPEETGSSFEENALLKARAAAAYSGYCALADDSGLCVAALDGAPGIYSARYSGEQASSAANNEKLLRELRDVPAGKREAYFYAALALVLPSGESFTCHGRVDGEIAAAPCGKGGFGYDPLFFLPAEGKTMAELSEEEKGEISHRGRALRALLPILSPLLQKKA